MIGKCLWNIMMVLSLSSDYGLNGKSLYSVGTDGVNLVPRLFFVFYATAIIY